MTKVQLVLVASFAIAGAVSSLMIQHQSKVKFLEREQLFQQQGEQLTALTAEQQRLSNLVARGNAFRADERVSELAKLRAEVEGLKKRTNDLSRRFERVDAVSPSQSPPTPESHPPEYWKQLHHLAGAKTTDALKLSAAFSEYANDHKGESPSTLDQVALYLSKNKLTLSGTNQFDIVYQGSFDKLEGIPAGEVAVIRDQEIWVGPNGKRMRVYGFAGGLSQIVESDDNFLTWEAKHIISSASARQSAP